MTKKKKTRIAIFTMMEGMNYGQSLQNYALQEVLSSFSDAEHDVKAESVRNMFWSQYSPFTYWLTAEECFQHPYLPEVMKQVPAQAVPWWLGRELLRHRAFHQFAEENQRMSAIKVTQEHTQADTEAVRDAYDWVVVGSDQIWNGYIICMSGFDFGICLPPERRISYAASFGVTKLPEQLYERYEGMFEGIAHISVREDAGVALVKEISGRMATVVPDPTLLLSKEIWRLVMKRPENLDTQAPYLLVYDLRIHDPAYVARVQEIAETRNLAVIMIPGDDWKTYTLGPAEFVYLVAHAAAVITDSFHGVCFSLIFERPVIAVVRSAASDRDDMSSRFDTLLPAYGIEQRRVKDLDGITAERLFCDDMQHVPGLLHERRKIGTSFLENALVGVGAPLRLNSVAVMRKDKCTGCTACAMACPQSAVTMESDDAGFLHPGVDRTRCTDCGRCIHVCPVCSPMQPDGIPIEKVSEKNVLPSYAVKAADEAIRMASASGGVFTLLAQNVLAAGGVVIGAAMGDATDSWNVRHIAVETLEELPKLQRSKYVQSEKGDIFAQTAAYLRAGRTVLFSGTGCEVQGLLRYLAAIGQETSRLCTVDLICHGVPSPALWQKYMRLRPALDGKAKSDVISAHFKDKREGWHRGGVSLTVEYQGGHDDYSTNDVFMKLFLNDLCLRDTCYACPARTQFMQGADAETPVAWRPSDLTIGDFWGIERTDLRALDDDKGMSIVFAHSETGRTMLARLVQTGAADVRPITPPFDFLRASIPAIFTDFPRPAERRAVMDAIGQKDGIELLAAIKAAVPQLFEGL